MKKRISITNLTDITADDWYIIVHTVQISIKTADLLSIYDDLAKIKNKPYVNKIDINVDRSYIIINPNKYGCSCIRGSSIDIWNRADSITTFQLIIADIGITDYILNRIDLAINTMIDFDNLSKINRYISSLLTVTLSSTNRYRATDIITDTHLMYLVRGGGAYSHVEIAIYNKSIQSDYTDFASTRIEFRLCYQRFTNIHQAVDSIIQHTHDLMINLLDDHIIDNINSMYVDMLYQRYRHNNVTSIISFLEYNRYIIMNRTILRDFLRTIGSNVPINKIMYKYKKGNHKPIEFLEISNSNRNKDQVMDIYIQSLLGALDRYRYYNR